MLTETQLTEIRNYLLSKKLPIDILIEVNDHFISQINDLQENENLSFEEAFEKVKDNWKEELTLSWDGSMNLENTTPFLRNVRQQIAKENFLIATKYTFIALLTIIGSGIILNQLIFKYFTFTTLLFFSISPFVNYVYHYKNFRIAKKYTNYILTLHQGGAVLFLGIFGVALQFDVKFFEHSVEIQKLIHLQTTSFGHQKIAFLILGITVLILMSIFSMISQKKYLEQIQKVKPFLKYL